MHINERDKYVEGLKNIKELLSKLMIVILVQLCITPYITLNNQNTPPFIIYNYILFKYYLYFI